MWLNPTKDMWETNSEMYQASITMYFILYQSKQKPNLF